MVVQGFVDIMREKSELRYYVSLSLSLFNFGHRTISIGFR